MAILSQQKQSQNTDFPNIRPSLDLRFALAKKLDPRITFTRGSIGTRTNESGLIETVATNIPRFDHDPITGQSLGLLIEESRTNLLTYSDDFSNAVWGIGNGSVSTNTITAPDGNTTADAFIENTTSNAYHYFNQSITKAASSITYTFSIFVKSKGGRRVGLRIESGGAGVVGEFNVVSGTVYSSPGTYGSGFSGASSTIVKYPNDWYRVILTATSNTSTSLFVQLYLVNANTNSSVYTGDGTSGIYIWGAQLEAGAFPTSYIPTTGSTVTRSADVASITGTNFSSWYNSSEGTIYSNISIGRTLTTSGTGSWTLDNGSFANGYSLYHTNTTSTRLSVRGPNTSSAGVSIGDVTGVDVTKLKNCSIILPSTTNRILSCSNAKFSGNVTSFSSGVTVNRLLIGLNNIIGTPSNNYLNGTISRLTYYPIQITNQQLINLTS